MAQHVFRLNHGLPLGKDQDIELQYDVTLRELTVADVLAAQEEAEKVVATPTGYALVMSPTRLGMQTIRRQIRSIGKVQGPLSLNDMGKLHPDDLAIITRHIDGLEEAVLQEVDSRGRTDTAPEDA